MAQSHVRYPPAIDFKRGFTALDASSSHVGLPAQRAVEHLINWRAAPMYFSQHRTVAATNDPTGKFYPIIHMPVRADAADRPVAVAWSAWGNPVNGAWYIKYEDAIAGYAQETIASDTNDAVAPAETGNIMVAGCHYTDYKPPAGGAANLHRGNFKVVEIETLNVYLASLTLFGAANASLADGQVQIKAKDVAPTHIISQADASLAGIHERIGDGDDTKESAERNSRRVFFNQGVPTTNDITAAAGYVNIVNNFVYPARARNLITGTSEVACYPALVVEQTGAAAGDLGYIRFSSTAASANTWVYTMQAGDPAGAPFLITFDRTGAAATTGLNVLAGAADDAITIEAKCDAGATLKLHTWALFEGPAW